MAGGLATSVRYDGAGSTGAVMTSAPVGSMVVTGRATGN